MSTTTKKKKQFDDAATDDGGATSSPTNVMVTDEAPPASAPPKNKKQFSMTAEEEASLREKYRNHNRNKKRSSAYNIRIARAYLPEMVIGPTYSTEDIAVVLLSKGHTPSGVGPSSSYLVNEGYLERTGRGQYKKIKDFDDD